MSRKQWRKFRYPVEYLAARLGFGLIDWLPPRLLARLALVVGSLTFACMRRRRHIAIDNLLKSSITSDPDDARRIARASFRNFSLLAVEALKTETLITPDNWADYADFDGTDDTVDAMTDSPEGCILVSAHFGNWETAGQIMSFRKPVVAVARKMNNPLTDRLINQRKEHHDFRFVPKTASGGGRLINALRDGCLLAMLADQHARQHGVVRNFLGRPAAVHTSPARLHLITGSPIYVGLSLRTAPFRFKVRIIGPIRHTPTGDRAADITAILDQIYAVIEPAIQAHPEQYLWAHRRWRIPEAPSPSG